MRSVIVIGAGDTGTMSYTAAAIESHLAAGDHVVIYNAEATTTDNRTVDSMLSDTFFSCNIPTKSRQQLAYELEQVRLSILLFNKHHNEYHVFQNVMHRNKKYHVLPQPPYIKRYRMDRLIGKREKRIGIKR